MFKKILPAILLSGSSILSFAQPTLTNANISPALGDTFITIVCDTTGIIPGPAGGGQNWDFSGLISTGTNTGAAVNAALTPGYALLTSYPGTTVASSNRAVQDITTSTTAYYTAGDTKLQTNGTFVSTNELAVYTDPLDQLHFPFTYASTFTDTYSGLVYFTPPTGPAILASEAGIDTVTADAYGTLKLPPVPPSSSPVTYTNVLRVHSRQSFRDSANLFGTPLVGTYELETYTWYQPGYHSGLLTISLASGNGVNGKVVSYAQRQVANHEAVPVVRTLENSLELFPNPVQNDLYIRFYQATGNQVRITLTDLLGREVALVADRYFQGDQTVHFSTSGLSKGVYFVRLQSGSQTATGKISVE